MRDRSHLHALEERLVRERVRLGAAASESERALRAAWVAQAEREITTERAFLGLPVEGPEPADDELLRELG